MRAITSALDDIFVIAVGSEGKFPDDARFVFRPAHHDYEDHQLHVHVPEKNEPVGSLHWRGKDGDISGLEVHPEYQRRGIATHLYTKAHELAQENNFLPPSGTPFQTPQGHGFRTNFDQLAQKPDVSNIPTIIDSGKGSDKTDLAHHMIEDHGFGNSQDYVNSMKPKDLKKWHDKVTQHDSCGWQG